MFRIEFKTKPVLMYIKLRMCEDETNVVNTVIDAIKTRRSVGNLLDKHVPESDIQSIMEVVTYAPSDLNMQPWKFIITSKAEMEKLSNMAKPVLYSMLPDKGE